MVSGIEKSRKQKRPPIPKFDPDPSGKFADKALRGADAKGILIGRLAVWAWIPDPAEHAFTKNVDIAVPVADLMRICSWLEKNSIKCRELEIGGINVSLPEGISVDFITRYCEEGNLSPLFEDAVRVSYESGETAQIGGREFPLVSREHLIAMKIATRERKDEEDAERLLETGETDTENLRKLITVYLGPMGRIALENILLIVTDFGEACSDAGRGLTNPRPDARHTVPTPGGD